MTVASLHIGPLRVALGRYVTPAHTVYLVTVNAREYVLALNRAGGR